MFFQNSFFGTARGAGKFSTDGSTISDRMFGYAADVE
jgi:hypothetical protein